MTKRRIIRELRAENVLLRSQHRQSVTEYEADLNAARSRLEIANTKSAATKESLQQARTHLESAWQILYAQTKPDDDSAG